MSDDDGLVVAFKRVLECFPSRGAGVVCAAADGRILAASPSFCELTGLTEPELTEAPLTDLIHPDDRQGFRDLLGTLGGSGRPPLESRSRLVRADGSSIWVQTSVSAVAGEPGERDYLVALVQDVTDLQSAEAQNAQLFGFPLALVFVAGLDGYFRRVGAGYERLLGWTDQELLSRPFFEFVHPDDLAMLGASIQDVATGHGEVVNQELRVLCKDGTYRWLIGNYRPVPD